MNDFSNRRKFLSTLGLGVVGAAASRPFTAMDDSRNASLTTLGSKEIKITAVKTYKVPRAIIIKVETNIGVTGWGESSPNSRPVIEAFIHDRLKKLVMGRDPFDVEPLWDELFWKQHDLGPSGALPYAIAGID